MLHCSDTKPSQDFTLEKLQACHKKNGFGQWPGYHFYLRRDGTIHYCRPMSVRGCHVAGWNTASIGVCYEGGHRDMDRITYVTDPHGQVKQRVEKYEDNRTAEQMVALHELLTVLHELFPQATFCGHKDLNPAKACPCLDAGHEYGYIFKGN